VQIIVDVIGPDRADPTRAKPVPAPSRTQTRRMDGRQSALSLAGFMAERTLLSRLMCSVAEFFGRYNSRGANFGRTAAPAANQSH